MKAYLNELINR